MTTLASVFDISFVTKMTRPFGFVLADSIRLHNQQLASTHWIRGPHTSTREERISLGSKSAMRDSPAEAGGAKSIHKYNQPEDDYGAYLQESFRNTSGQPQVYTSSQAVLCISEGAIKSTELQEALQWRIEASSLLLYPISWCTHSLSAA